MDIADFYHWRAFAELSPYVLICDGDDNFLRTYIQTSRNCEFKIEYINKYFPILSTLPAFLLASFIDCDYGIWGVALISLLYLAKSIKISAVIMAVLLVPYYGQHIYSNVVSFGAIRNMCFHFCLFCLFACTMGNTEARKSGFIIGHTRYTFYSLQFCVVSAW